MQRELLANRLTQNLDICCRRFDRARFRVSENHVKTVTAHQAKTHLSRLLKEVQAGETVIILSGSAPVARLTAIRKEQAVRPPVGTMTSPEVRYTEDAFRPLIDDELQAWGL